MNLNRLLIATSLLASGTAMALDVTVGKVPVGQLEAMGWNRADADTLEFLAPNGVLYQVSQGDRRLRALRDELAARRAALTADESDELAFLQQHLDGNAASTTSESVEICAGTLDFNPEFFYGMADGSVTSTVSWTEFGPFGPNLKRIQAKAIASAPGLKTDQRTTSSGWFSGQFYQSVSASAGVYPTFEPSLTALGYFASNGCGSYTFSAEALDSL